MMVPECDKPTTLHTLKYRFSLHVQALTACAYAGSGVSRAESLALDNVNLYERLGQKTIEEVSSTFYDR